MKLYVVQCGFCDEKIGTYELHTNFVVAAANIAEVKKIIQEKDIFINKKMHFDSINEISVVDGYRVSLVEEKIAEKKSKKYATV